MTEQLNENRILKMALILSLSLAANQYKDFDQASKRVSSGVLNKTVHKEEVLLTKLKSIYKYADEHVIKAAVNAALKHEHKDFPKAEDLLALIGVESSFNPKSVSNLPTDKAVGLTQIRPKTTNTPMSDLQTPDQQIAVTSKILNKNYQRLGSKEAALHSYNVGVKNHFRSKHDPKKGNPRYVPKIERIKDQLKEEKSIIEKLLQMLEEES